MSRWVEGVTKAVTCDLCVVGAGSGGFSAALAAARMGASVILIEKHDTLGGNAIRCGVHAWEAVAGATGIPFDLYRRVRAEHGSRAIGINSIARHACFGDAFPGGEWIIDPDRCYLDTLRRHDTRRWDSGPGGYRDLCHAVPFESEPVERTMRLMLEETGRVDVRTEVTFGSVEHDAGHIRRLRLSDGRFVEARTYIDATADVLMCRAIGCTTRFGQESRAVFDEPDAPDEATDRLNGVTLIYRVNPCDKRAIDDDAGPTDCWWGSYPVACFNHYPAGGLNVNMLPTMQGREAWDRFERDGFDAVYQECERRVRAHWHWLQRTYDEFRGYRLAWIAPGLGVRESHRIVAEITLTEHDLLAGVSGQRHPDIIALADHVMDTHGSHRAASGDLAQPYGVPFRSLVPRGMRNVLVACRGAGFSAIAASSCRLSRTMMQLGQAAGVAAALSADRGCDVVDVDIDDLRQHLREQHVQLEHPMAPSLRQHLTLDGASPCHASA